MFDLDRFIEDCRGAVATDPSHKSVREIVAHALYGGDFFAVSRSEWDPESLTEGRYDLEKNMRLFAEANRA